MLPLPPCYRHFLAAARLRACVGAILEGEVLKSVPGCENDAAMPCRHEVREVPVNAAQG